MLSQIGIIFAQIIVKTLKMRNGLLKYMLCAILLAVCLKADAESKPLKQYSIKVIETLHHDRNAYTQGLFFNNNQLYESAGQYNESSFRKVDVKTGKVLRRLNFDAQYFVEGSCVIDGRLYILTWKEHKCFVYDIESFKYLGELYNPREGWGLTSNGKELLLSDGSDKIFFLDPMTFAVNKTISVTINGKSLQYINELEVINGDIWANVYGEDYIIIADITTGVVKGVIDCNNLLPMSLKNGTTDVLNGIAYNPLTKSIYVTGKYWPKMYRIELVEK